MKNNPAEPLDTVGKRLKAIRKALNLSQEAFGARLGGSEKPIEKATISRYENDIAEISAKAKVELYTTLKVSKDFLEAGVAPMFVDGSSTQPSKVHSRNARSIGEPVDVHTTKGGNNFVEMSEGYYIMYPHVVSVKARASYMLGWGDEEYIESLPVHPAVVKEIHKGTYLWFDIDGDSMDDGSRRSIGAGDKALGRQINRSLWRSKLHYKEFPFFIIVHAHHGIMCKEITKHDVEAGVLTCHSLNPNKQEFPDFEIRLDECIQIFNIVKVERDARG